MLSQEIQISPILRKLHAHDSWSAGGYACHLSQPYNNLRIRMNPYIYISNHFQGNLKIPRLGCLFSHVLCKHFDKWQAQHKSQHDHFVLTQSLQRIGPGDTWHYKRNFPWFLLKKMKTAVQFCHLALIY